MKIHYSLILLSGIFMQPNINAANRYTEKDALVNEQQLIKDYIDGYISQTFDENTTKKIDDADKPFLAAFGQMLNGILTMIATDHNPEYQREFNQALQQTIIGLSTIVITGMEHHRFQNAVDKKEKIHHFIKQSLDEYIKKMLAAALAKQKAFNAKKPTKTNKK